MAVGGHRRDGCCSPRRETCHPAHDHDAAEAPVQAPPSGVVAARLAASAVGATSSIREGVGLSPSSLTFHDSPLTVPAAARALFTRPLRFSPTRLR